MAIAASARNLVVGSGNCSVTSGLNVLTFVNTQIFKRGATVVFDHAGTPQYFTIDFGSDKSWTAVQKASSTSSGKAFKTTDTGSGRGRGTDGVIVPDAPHFMYRAQIDNSAIPDWYHYSDTVYPENGLHPYTKDPLIGSARSAKAVQAYVPDIETRVRIIEGYLRANATPGDTLNGDKRLDAIESRLNALDSGGTLTVTLQQSNRRRLPTGVQLGCCFSGGHRGGNRSRTEH